MFRERRPEGDARGLVSGYHHNMIVSLIAATVCHQGLGYPLCRWFRKALQVCLTSGIVLRSDAIAALKPDGTSASGMPWPSIVLQRT
jgi:hypothetical protein